MKSLKKLFRRAKDNIDPEDVKNYLGQVAHDHDQAGHSHSGDNENKSGNKYKCPMNCEGDKTYDAPRRCPVCNMNLKMVGENHNHH
jgi:hypothetical protein